MTPVSYSDKDKIISDVADRYSEWRRKFGAPKTDSAIAQMVADVLTPLLDKLSSWDLYESSAQHTIYLIKDIIAEKETQNDK